MTAAPTRGRAKSTDHIMHVAKGNTLLCQHCGSHYAIALPAPVSMVTAQWDVFLKEHRACKLTERGLACSACFKFGHTREACARMQYEKPTEWWNGPDTGSSSKTIWRVMMGVPLFNDHSVPYDPSDFGRCHRLLQAFPEWRARMDEMAAVPGWKALAQHWAELEALFEEEKPSGKCPKLYARLDALRGRS